MTTPLTRRYARQLLYKEFGPDVLGFFSTATSVSATGVTDEVRFGATNENVNRYAFGRLYRPNQPVPANKVKETGAVSTSTLLHVSNTNYTDDFSDLYYEWLQKAIFPDDLNEKIRLALRKIYFETYCPITPWGDGDMSALDIDSWVPSSGSPTIAKSQAAAQNLDGFQSLIVTNNAASQYAAAAVPVPVMPNERYYLAANCIIVRGTSARFRIFGFDVNGASIGEILPSASGAPVASGAAPAHLHGTYTIPANCYAITCHLQGDAANSIAAWTDLPGHDLAAKRLDVPTWMDAGFKLIDFLEAEYGLAPAAPNVEPALSKRYHAWYRPQDYETQIISASANPEAVQINRDGDLPEHDLWFHGWRAWSDQTTLEDDTTTVGAPEDQFKAAILYTTAGLLWERTNDARYQTLQTQAETWLLAQLQARRPQMQPREASTTYVVGGRPTGRFSQDGRGGDW